MEVRAALLLMTAAHVVAASSNGSDPRSFAVFRQTEAITYEPIDFPLPEVNTWSSRLKHPDKANSSTRRTRPGPSCNSSTQNCNRTAPVETLHVSDLAHTFLTGPLATRFFPIIYSLVFLISVPLNAMALVVFTCRVRQKKSVVVYMSQLALADLLFGLLLPLKVHYYARGSDWVFGEAACRVLTTAFYAYVNCSVLLVMCMSVDRMLAVAYPFASLYWRKPWIAALVCAGAWILALVGTMPLLTMQQTMQISQVGVTCHDVLDPEDSRYLDLFSSISCLFFFLPLIVTMVCYVVILRALRPQNSFQEALASSSLSRKRRRRATVMVFAVMVEFVVCFAPTNAILLVHCLLLGMDGKSAGGDGMYAAYMVALCLGSISTCLDPLLYYFGSSQCRLQISAALWWRRGKQAAGAFHSCSTQETCQYSSSCSAVSRWGRMAGVVGS
ncbi:proteinase-activated receptor 1-like [Salminus brasiliensis]|uniref:proteinase-activated receptor 1-like n=1 Tax=Salminus brasiliensis TaxID=930266 RepID=UPI003B834B5E